MDNTKRIVNKSLLDDIADAIREKEGSSESIVASTFPSRIAAIETGTDTSDATAVVSDILLGKTAYLADGEKHTGTIPTWDGTFEGGAVVEDPIKKIIDESKNSQYMFSGSSLLTSNTLNSSLNYNTTENSENTQYMFSGCSALTSFPNIDIRKSKNCLYMFNSCTNLEGLPSVLDFSSNPTATQLAYMFKYCKIGTFPTKIKFGTMHTFYNMFEGTKMSSVDVELELDLEDGAGHNLGSFFASCTNLTSAKVLLKTTYTINSISSMFSGCSNLITGELMATSGVRTSNNFGPTSLFYNCYNLKTAFLFKYNSRQTYSSATMFGNCYSVTKIIIKSFGTYTNLNSSAFSNCYHLTGTVNETYNPNGDKDCYIYVPDNYVNSLKNSTNWSLYADQIKGLSELSQEDKTRYDIS